MKQGHSSAFSLIEVLCAILILGFGVVGLTQGITTALVSAKEAEVQTAASALAAAQIELLRAEGFVIEGELEGEGEGDLGRYAWRQSVRETDIRGLFEVRVSISSTNSGQEIFELSTMLFDPPLMEEERAEREKERERQRGRE